MAKVIIGIVLVVGLFIVFLNASMLATQAQNWVKANPKDPKAPEVLFYAARWCDILGSNDKAMEVYNQICDQYPDAAEYDAPALYHMAEIQEDLLSSKKFALPYLDKIISNYPDSGDWVTKAKEMEDQINYVR